MPTKFVSVVSTAYHCPATGVASWAGLHWDADGSSKGTARPTWHLSAGRSGRIGAASSTSRPTLLHASCRHSTRRRTLPSHRRTNYSKSLSKCQKKGPTIAWLASLEKEVNQAMVEPLSARPIHVTVNAFTSLPWRARVER